MVSGTVTSCHFAPALAANRPDFWGICAAIVCVFGGAALIALHTPPGGRFVLRQVTQLLGALRIELGIDELRYNLAFTSQAFAYSPSWLGAGLPYLRYFGQYFHDVPLRPPQRKRFTNEILRPRSVYARGVRLGLARDDGRVDTCGGAAARHRSDTKISGSKDAGLMTLGMLLAVSSSSAAMTAIIDTLIGAVMIPLLS
jgi:hypothetical protein